MALHKPDEYAWRLFVALNWPADLESCSADSAKRLGDKGPVVWETWAERTQVYDTGGADPGEWDDICGTTVIENKRLLLAGEVVASLVDPFSKSFVEPFAVEPSAPASSARDEEVRLNKDTYEFVRSEKLYLRSEQQRRASELRDAVSEKKPIPATSDIQFPVNAKEVKAHWLTLEDPADFSRYHTVEIPDDTGNLVTWGLVALSITTKDLPNWLWTTFEHEDNETRWADDPRLDTQTYNFAGWKEVPSVDRFSCSSPPYNCNDFPKGLGLEGTVWANYRLRGTQIDFIDRQGRPTLLVNSKIERTFNQRSMSCITCHAYASVDANGDDMPIFILKEVGPKHEDNVGHIGSPVAELFDARKGIMPLDFVWSLRRAK